VAVRPVPPFDGGLPQPPGAGVRLWLALEFPDLALECLRPTLPGDGPRAVSVPRGRRPVLLALNAAARDAGLHEGMPVTAAAALCPALVVARHDPIVESAALEGLASWAGCCTSLVSLQPPRGLLLEIGASLRLFGGLGPLLERVRQDLVVMGHRVRQAVAPTSAAAWLLARAGDPAPVTVAARLADRLSRVPVTAMELPPRTVEDLEALGLATFGDCARLPRDGSGRRLGPGLLALLDRALGRRPDPRQRWQPPPCFERRLDLPVEGADRALLLRAAECLLHELGGFLTRHDRGAGALELHLAHSGRPATRCVLELSAPSRDPRHLLALVRERLEHLPLEHEVAYLALRVERLLALSPSTGDLYAGPRPGGGGGVVPIRVLAERLGARLGHGAVRALARVADHRPEHATRETPWPHTPEATGDGGGVTPREMPLWLLPEPRPMDAAPHGAGGTSSGTGATRMRVEQGPWRIESGWWDGRDVARDYYVARDAGGARCWIYRECRTPARWFLHGLFA
jgi:protein ImuB